MVEGSYEALKVEIDHIKEDIKEIKTDNKEMKDYYRDVIGELKENFIQQTMILKNQESQFARVNTDIEKVNTDVAELSDKIDANTQSQTKWYQDFITGNFGFILKVMVVLVLGFAGVKLGFDVVKLLGM